ncbi:MAG: DNA lyase [Candidatus Omnitrophica bacterium CG12_big_fil_rev_8_21_14_0_65_43_15]|uniref:8-oxoguanine DNA glycosylase/AP lyase n=1 Tax=Candidatus Taenaricola geysiri TaxID=1974752 RepID=A0A2J0LMW2_9BACT|nr:MAG: DNA lyase [Candidatus Omnitrophica bacterium CG10_big_fil_rev_8_21_14_0_10_43_8]PIW66056.1 MAG: DNA lyase [Candidatus Omnitrophica bacterium CG12_big_fil_rev_8_21_14_0_65_43_15]PIW80049.1 MAG: DNA lyase [Candidatus Omnitrophica bacterium CG_4_8_14_3_um_filter_43_15]PIY84851.1 MAG: DNA lyase [Candidatus Omnitrophica bacterium CG_4_10_14_0_8_um_filter_43_18]PJC46315.1 MAG: DNA lyase [Candidatus Omnitrophica bacterium CG_4_9_14_0_2_um_filter_43_12]
MNRKDLLSAYKKRKKEIKQRLAQFNRVRKLGNKRLFKELCFCICTPQSKAVNCDKAIQQLVKAKALYNAVPEDIARYLKGLVRFHNNKAKYIVRARKIFFDRPELNRKWLVKNIKGLGLKEASHFLRNIGLGSDLAIIDRHVLTNLSRCGVIKRIPESISAKQYLIIEDKMRRFSKDIGIPMVELDLLFWSEETGHIFK